MSACGSLLFTIAQVRCSLAPLGCKLVSYTGWRMDIEHVIAEIEQLERIFAVPDHRPLSPSDISPSFLRRTCTRLQSP